MSDAYNHDSYTACSSELEFEEFKAKAPVGEKAADFTLSDLEGRRVSLADFRGRYLVLEFGSIT
jgi:cytochrome oxidase Cu insertion factor (SCO1/SenC/PrrC family)